MIENGRVLSSRGIRTLVVASLIIVPALIGQRVMSIRENGYAISKAQGYRGTDDELYSRLFSRPYKAKLAKVELDAAKQRLHEIEIRLSALRTPP